jgi:DNA invertase Pin-like site-specific DNA recombinase
MMSVRVKPTGGQVRVAAIYARVFSERQRQEQTIQSQTAALRELAEQRDLLVPEEFLFEDDGFSGSSLQRPALERLRNRVFEGCFEVVLCHAPDRLARRYAYQVLLLEEFARGGIEVVFAKEPERSGSPEDELLRQFQGMIAEYERDAARGKRICPRGRAATARRSRGRAQPLSQAKGEPPKSRARPSSAWSCMMHRDVGVCSIGTTLINAVLLLRQQRGHAVQPAPGLWNGRAPALSSQPSGCCVCPAMQKAATVRPRTSRDSHARASLRREAAAWR